MMMITLLTITILEFARAAHEESPKLHDGCLNTTDGSVPTSSPFLTSDYMRAPCDGHASNNHMLSILKLLETLHWNRVIVFYDLTYRDSDLQLLLPVLGLATIYDLSDLHSSVEVKQLLQQLYKKFFPRLNFLLLSSCSRALELIQIVDKLDLESNRTTEYSHHSYWVVACYCSHEPITRLLLDIYHLENVVLIVPSKDGSTEVHRLVTTSGRSFTASDEIEIKEKVFPNTRYGLNNRTLIVSTLLYEPFIMKKGNRIEGYLIDILDAIASTLNFSYEIVHPADKSYGEVVDGRWDGFIGQLERREVDLTVAALTIHEDRENVMDFLYPPVYNWMDDIMYKLHTEETGSWQIYVKPFSSIVLLVLSITLVVSTLMGYILTRWDDANTGKGGNSWKSWMCIVADTFFNMFGILIIRGLAPHGKNSSTRVLLFAWGIFSVIIAACYSANLVASFAVQKLQLPFTSLGELVRQKEYTWGFESGTIKQHIFNRSRSGNMQMAWEGVLKFNKTDPEVLRRDDSVHIAKVKREKYATVIFRYTAEKLRRQDCSIHYVGQDIIWHQIGIGVPTDYPLKKELEDILYDIADSGLLDTWWRRWSKLKDDHCIEDGRVNTLHLSDVSSAFYLFCGGLGVAGFVLGIEVILRHVGH